MLFIIGQSQQVLAQKVLGLEVLGLEAPLWHGYEILDSVLNGSSYKIVFPKTANENRDWIWRARFWGHEHQTDTGLLEMGFQLITWRTLPKQKHPYCMWWVMLIR